MIVKGKRTTVDTVVVDVNPREVLAKIYDMSIPNGLDNIGDDGFWYKQVWYKQDGFDYHKQEELYEKDRAATEQELEMQRAYRIFTNFIRERGL